MGTETREKPAINLTDEAIAQGVALTRNAANEESAFRYLARQAEAILRACPTCHGARVVQYAGSLERDEGYCEIRTCSTCSDGRRLGRSDTSICAEPTR